MAQTPVNHRVVTAERVLYDLLNMLYSPSAIISSSFERIVRLNDT